MEFGLDVDSRDSPKTLIIAGSYGRLANGLFRFAHCMAFAEANSFRLVNLAFCEYARFFVGGSNGSGWCPPLITDRLSPPHWVWKLLGRTVDTLVASAAGTRLLGKHLGVIKLRSGETLRMDRPEFSQLVSGYSAVLLRGWLFRDHGDLQRHGGVVREYFSLVSPHSENVRSLVTEIRKGCEVLVGVHMRQGDYRRNMGGEYYYTAQQYGKMMKDVERLFPGRAVGFLVCSDGTPDRGYFKEVRSAAGTGHVAEDLYALAECDYLIGPPSTYSMWASFYGNVPIY